MELAQAATPVIAGPSRPSSIDTWQEAMLLTMSGTKNAPTRSGPRRARISLSAAMVVTPPPPVLITAAIRSRPTASRSSPASASASRDAATASWAKRAIRFAALGAM